LALLRAILFDYNISSSHMYASLLLIFEQLCAATRRATLYAAGYSAVSSVQTLSIRLGAA